MAVRADIHVEWARSPRVIMVEAPSLELTIQDLVDTIRTLEPQLENLDEPSLINASGKEALGGGTFVGITVELTNAQIAFEQLVNPGCVGTATADQSAGTVLTDSTADFISSGAAAGETIVNFTDGSISTITEVIDEHNLRHYQLGGGSSNQWHNGDSYKVFHKHGCKIYGGNLTAVDANGDPMYPVFHTFGTNVSYILSTAVSGVSSSEDVAAMVDALLHPDITKIRKKTNLIPATV